MRGGAWTGTRSLMGGLTLVGSALGGCLGLVGEEEIQRIRVCGVVQSVDGYPVGASFLLVDEARAEVIVAGRTDNMGEIDCEVGMRMARDEVAIILFSVGMLRNGLDECVSAGAAQARMRVDNEWWHPVMIEYGIAGLADLLAVGGREWGWRVLRDRTGGNQVEVMRRVASARGAVVDFGVLRFHSSGPAAELNIDLVDEGGREVSAPVVMSGYNPGSAHHPSGRVVYRYVALSQRRNRVRILLTDAGVRLAAADPERFVRIALGGNPWVFGTIPIPPDGVRALQAGERKVLFNGILRIPSSEAECVWASSGSEPPNWWVGSPCFTWW